MMSGASEGKRRSIDRSMARVMPAAAAAAAAAADRPRCAS
jgi:hypothetical protein